MKFTQPSLRLIVGLLLMAAAWPSNVLALPAPPKLAVPGGLSFAELKVTGDEYLTLQNNSGATIPDLSSYWLEDFNNVNPLASGVSNSSQQLPATSLAAGQTLLLSATTTATCGATVAGKLSVSLSDGGGFLELVQMKQVNGLVTQTAGDAVSWSSGTSGLIQNVPSSTKDARAAYYRYLSGNSYVWQLADTDTVNACQLNVVVAGGSLPQTDAITPLALAATSPPATILSVMSSADQAPPPSLPTRDIGLKAPQLSELLPNPSGTGNDASDEFIELYNPNPTIFDLSGFILQTGLTASHSYTLPADSLLPPLSFSTFYSADTGLSLSNTSGMAILLDPFGNLLSKTEPYATAKDGYAWALAKGKWYWTTDPTPGSANIIKQPAATKKAKGASSSKKKTAKYSAATTSSNKNQALSTATTASSTTPATPIHATVLALVAAAAVLYGAYEYRHDLRNRIYQFRSNRDLRRPPGT